LAAILSSWLLPVATVPSRLTATAHAISAAKPGAPSLSLSLLLLPLLLLVSSSLSSPLEDGVPLLPLLLASPPPPTVCRPLL
jgi:hypothetical protein